MISRAGALTAFLLTAVLIMPVSAGTYNVELDVRNTIEEFDRALKKSDLAAMAKLVAPDFVVVENGEIKRWKLGSDRSSMAELPRFLQKKGSKIERVEVSSNLAWANGRTDVTDPKAVANQPRLVIATMYVLRQKSHRWKVVALSWSVSPQSPTKNGGTQ
jgi:ketosteroid isomerase-like protein